MTAPEPVVLTDGEREEEAYYVMKVDAEGNLTTRGPRPDDAFCPECRHDIKPWLADRLAADRAAHEALRERLLTVLAEPEPESEDYDGTPEGNRAWGEWFGRYYLAHDLLAAAAPTPPQEDPDPTRCGMYAQDPITTRYPREDGWRCGHGTDRRHNHELFSVEGEQVLYAGSWASTPRTPPQDSATEGGL